MVAMPGGNCLTRFRNFGNPRHVSGSLKLKLIVDRTDAIGGIKDLYSRSIADGLPTIPGKGDRYSDW